MNARVVSVGLSALALVGLMSCGSDSGTGAPSQTTVKLGQTSYVTLAPVLTSTTPPPTSTNPDGQPTVVGDGVTYTVVGGDIVVRIASKYCITPNALAEFNAWAEGYNHPINPGDIIRIPPTACTPGSNTGSETPTTNTDSTTPQQTSTTIDTSQGTTYEVVDGDYLSLIATKIGTTMDAIVAANGWADGIDHKLYPGDKIKVPAKSN